MYETYVKLRDSRGVTDYQVAKETGLGRATFTDMKNGGHRPNISTLQKLADYFNVSIDYLMTGRNSEKESIDGTKWYFSDDTARLAQEAHDNPDMRLLFDAARDSRPEDIQMATEMLRRFKATNPGG